MKKSHALVACLAALALVVGCSDDGGDDKPTAKADAAGGDGGALADAVVSDAADGGGGGLDAEIDGGGGLDAEVDGGGDDETDGGGGGETDGGGCDAGSEGCACDDKGGCAADLFCKEGKTCVAKADCPVGTQGCPCDPDQECVDGLFCRDGAVCALAADCPTGTKGCPCSDKDTCNVDLFCKAGESCQPAESCPTSAVGCPCTQDKGCGDGLFCAGASETCVKPADCPKGALGCPCPTGEACGEDLACGPANVCAACTFGTKGCPCSAGATCGAGLKCEASLCVDDPCFGKEGQVGCGCKEGGACDAEAWCQAGVCQVCKADGPGCACGDKQPCAGGLTCGDDSTCKPCADHPGAIGCAPGAEGSCLAGNTLNEASGLCEACAPGKLGCECTASKTCSGSYKCNQKQNVCVACATPAGCPCVSKSDCGAGLLCDAEQQACVSCEAGAPGCDCKGTGVTACSDGFTCELGTCKTCTPGKLGCPQACNVEFPQPVKVVGKTTCAACEGNCKAPSQTGVVSPSQTKNGICICETKEGYFWEASSGKSEPCDGDGDGWIRQTALDAMRSDDPVIKANARCASVLHRVDMLGLITEQGVALPIDITTVLAPSIFKAGTLYQDGKGGVVLTEPLLYDSEELLAGQVATGGFPNFAGGRAPKAAELNPLTKSCVSAGADFNGNGIADVEEWPGHAKAKPDAISQLAIKFSYWIELHRGWWAKAPPPVTLPVGATPVDPANAATPVGVYFVAEKHRALLAPGPTQLALVEPTTTSQGYWRQCRRQVASDYKTAVNDGATTIGFDFASWSHQSPAWGQGMTHHSQFHCAVIAAVDAVLSESEKQFKIRSSELDKKWTVNECKYGASSHAPLPISATQITAFDDKSQARNPSDPVASGCSVAAPSTGAAYWLVARYTPYIKAEDYGRGCINECIDAVVDTCPYVLNDPHSMYACIGNKDNSGAAMCTCNNGYYGEPAKGCAPKCGDGIIATSNEVCDDGNTNTNDGCSDACQCEGWSTPVLSSKVGPNGYSYKTGTCQCGEDDLKPKVELAGVCGGGGSPKAVDLGTIAKASTPEIVTGGRIRFGESEDWFRVYAPDLQQVVLNGTGTELYNLAVDLSLDSTPGSDAFVMDIFRGPKEDLSCQKAEPVCSSETQHTWKSVFEKCMRRPGMDGTCGGKPCTGSTSGWTTLPKGAIKPSTGGWFYGYGSPTAPMHCPDYSAYYYIRVKRAAKTPTTCGGYKLVLKSAAN